jgi:hypothetical protein
MNRLSYPIVARVTRHRALPAIAGVETPGLRPPGPGNRPAEYEFRELVERMSEVCWEATRAHIRSEFDSSAAIDPRVPRKWQHADASAKHLTRTAVMGWWNGSEDSRNAPAITHVCRAIVLEFKRQHSTGNALSESSRDERKM